MRPRPKKRYSAVIYATALFDNAEIKEYEFGECEVEEVQICEMGVKEVDGEIRYKSVGGVSLTPMDETKADDMIEEESVHPRRAEAVHKLAGELK